MQMRSYISTAIADFPKNVRPDVVASACSQLGVSESVFCDMFAREVACAYLQGTISWSEADTAMNALSGYFFLHLSQAAPFPDYAFGVFGAFDAGEGLAEPDNERVTREHLESLHAKA